MREKLQDSVYTALAGFQIELHEKPNIAKMLGSGKTITLGEKKAETVPNIEGSTTGK